MNKTNYSSRSSRRSSAQFGRKNYNQNISRSKNRNRTRGQNIDPNRFVKVARITEQEKYVPKHTFNDFDIDKILKSNLTNRNYKIPSKIQDNAIPVALEGRDVIGIANTGTGKTAAFLLPLLNKLLNNSGKKALIIAPTRELALQIQEESRLFSKGTGLLDAVIIGGVPVHRQLRELQRNPEIIIGTPGRIKDHIKRKTLTLNHVNTIVLDEVDRMLDMGFVTDIKDILENLPDNRQSLFFSATLSPTIENLIGSFTKDPVTIMARTAETSDNVDQSVVHYYENSEKIDKLHELLVNEQFSRTLIFCETKRSTEALSKELTSRGFTSDAIHGNKNQGQRQRALKNFKDGRVCVLVATDVAARGIDVNDISHVINYDIPQTYEDYTHRIGRTGRAGSVGYAITFVNSRS